MINIFLIVLMVLIPLILIACNIYIMIYFQHPEEIGVNWFWRIIIIIALELCELSVLLIPADVMNAGPPYGEIPMEIIWYVVYYVLIAMVLLILPFMLWWFNQDLDEKVGKKLLFSLIFTAAFLLVVAVFSAIFYLIFGVAEVPVKSQSFSMDLTEFVDDEMIELSVTEGAEIYEPQALVAKKIDSSVKDTMINYRISVVLFLIAGVSTLGFALVVIFGGIGFGVLPVGLIFSFINRPQPIKDVEKKKYTKLIGEKALKMIDDSKEIRKMTGIKYRRRFQKFREDVYILDRALKALNKRTSMKGFLWGYIALILGILACIGSGLWCIQLILSMFEVPFALFDFIMSWMTGPLSFFGIIFYGVFALYLFACAFKAVVYVGFRFALGFIFYPLEVGNTYMNSFCFNSILLAFIGFGVNTICSETFATFTSGTSIEMFLGNSITELRYVKYLYQYAPLIMPILAVIFIVFMILSKVLCKHKKEKDDLEILLEQEHVNTKE